VSAFANCGRAVRFMPISGVIELRARSALELYLKLQAARGRLRAGAAGRVNPWPVARGALYGFGCGLPLTGRPGPDALPVSPVVRVAQGSCRGGSEMFSSPRSPSSTMRILLFHHDIAADQSAFNALPAVRAPFHHWATSGRTGDGR